MTERDPPRLRDLGDDSGLDDALRAFAAAPLEPAYDPAARWASVESAIASARPTPAWQLSGKILLKILMWTSVVVLVGVMSVLLSRETPSAPARVVPVHAPIVLPPEPRPSVADAQRWLNAHPVQPPARPPRRAVQAQPQRRRATPPTEATTEATGAQPKASAPSMADELALVVRMRTRCKPHPAECLTLHAEGVRRFGKGVLGQERDAYRVLALLALGKPSARSAAERHLKRHPLGPLTQDIRTALHAAAP